MKLPHTSRTSERHHNLLPFVPLPHGAKGGGGVDNVRCGRSELRTSYEYCRVLLQRRYIFKISSYIRKTDLYVPGDTFQRDRTLRTQPSLISTSLFFSRPKSRAAGLYVALSTPGPPVMPFRGWLCSDASSTEALVQPEACCEKFHAFPASPHRAQLCSPPTGRLYCSHFCLRSSCEFLRTKGKRTT